MDPARSHQDPETRDSASPEISLPIIVGLQLAIVGLAVLLGWLFNVDLLLHCIIDGQFALWSLTGTAVLCILFVGLVRAPWKWAHGLRELVKQRAVPLFINRPRGTLFLVALLAGVGEELLFRGVIQGALTEAVGPFPALITASLVFGLLHALSVSYFIVATAIGLFLGLLYYWSGNLLVPIAVHFLYDWIALHYYVQRVDHGIAFDSSRN